MRIGIDARELLGARTGVGRYLEQLLQHWIRREDAHHRRFVLYTPQELSINGFAGPAIEQRVLHGAGGTLWEQITLRRAVNRERPDVFFAPGYTAPLGLQLPFAVAIHDISFTAHPEWFRWREGTRRRFLTRRAAESAAAVITISEFSRGEIERHYAVRPERVDVIPPGVTPRIAGSSRAREPAVLYVGSIFNRRRLPDLIEAFAMATADTPGARLVIVGDNRTWPRQDLAAIAEAHRAAERTELRSYVSDEELAFLYSRAAAFAFLSEYEGFGFTPLEALAAGVPIVVLDTPVAREMYGPAATYVQRGDIAATAGVLRRLLRDPGAPTAELAAAPDVLARYSWDVAAARTLARLEEIAR